MKNRYLEKTDILLMRILACGLSQDNAVEEHSFGDSLDMDYDRLIDRAKHHKVEAIVADVILGKPEMFNDMSDNQRSILENCVSNALFNGSRLIYYTREYLFWLKKENVRAAVLKGWSVAGYYRVPEIRKSGDIDIIVKEEDYSRAVEVFTEKGFIPIEEQHSNHHLELKGPDGVVVELHNTLAEHFDSDRVNECVRKYGQQLVTNTEEYEYNGYIIPRGTPEYNALSLIVHMLQHYLRAGFGVKLLCDWTVFINNGIDEKQYLRFADMAADLGIYGFVDMINHVCGKYLGLNTDKIPLIFNNSNIYDNSWDEESLEEFLADIMESGEFGHEDNNRMVAVNGTGLWAYIKEFHHQMRINNPDSSRFVIIWPFLWLKTLVVFLKNNRKVRKTSTMNIIKNAGRRGKIIKSMNLFKR